MIRQNFLKSVTDNIPIIDTNTRGGWKALNGGNGMRFHFPDMETQQPRLYRVVAWARQQVIHVVTVIVCCKNADTVDPAS